MKGLTAVIDIRRKIHRNRNTLCEMKGLTAVIDIKTEADKVDWNSFWNLWWVKNPPTVMAKILQLLR